MNIGFYALPYDTNGDGKSDIISYRGTDYPEENTTRDLVYDWTLGAGSTSSEQARMAIEFYKDVVGDANVLTSSVSLTGHSLGGGLAGLVTAVENKKAIISDNMQF